MPLYRAELLTKKPLWHGALIHDVSRVLYLPFDYDDGSYARDRSGHGNHGTIYGAATVEGKMGAALSFDGVDDHVRIPDSASLDLTAAISIEAWFKPNRVNYAYDQEIVSKHYSAYELGIAPNTDEVVFVLSITGTYTGLTSTGADLQVGVWYHVVATYDGSTMKIYVNGAEVGSRSAVGTIDVNDYFLAIGARGGFATKLYEGCIDEVRMYNRALSRDEIRMLMYRRLI